MYSNIPEELRLLRNWVVWKFELLENGKQTKIPYSINGHPASVTNPNTWASFEEACAAAPAYNGIGFVLEQKLGYSIIDLDNKPEHPCTPEQLTRHTKILEHFQSYSEISVSGTGVHIICKGTVPAGVKRDNVEVYSHARYMACTGNVLNNAPIDDCQDMLNVLFSEMQPAARMQLEELDAIITDADLVDMAQRAANGAKFDSLCNGIMDEYPSQSEADFALLAILAFYTKSNEQVRRIFRLSNLGQRAKATRNNKYLNIALERIRAQQPPPMDFSAYQENAKKLEAPPMPAEPEEVVSAPPPISDMTLPPGLVGEIAQYIYQSSVRPVPETSLAAAIACVAGVCGRSFNISNTGLNQYVIMLARTGTGKEDAAAGIERLFNALRPTVPMIDQYMGPAVFASGQALGKRLAEQPCFVSILGEFGLTLQMISDPRANNAEKMLKKVLLDIYAKSGHQRSLQSSVYSDSEKNTALVRAPNVTILGESTPESFFDGIDAQHIAEGLIPRFSIIEYIGPRPARNKAAGFTPPKELLQRFSDLVVASISMSNNNTCTTVEMDEISTGILDKFDILADSRVNQDSQNNVETQLWNRAHVKALKLAALLAVGVNPHKPVITQLTADWAIQMVTRDIDSITRRFRAGDVGKGDSKQMADLRHAFETYFKAASKTLKTYGVPEAMIEAKIIPYLYLLRKTASVASFRTDKNGATMALKKCIQAMVEAGMIVEVAKPVLSGKYGFSGAAYMIGSSFT